MPPRVASRMKRVAGAAASIAPTSPCSGGAVAVDRRIKRHVAARSQDCRAMVAQHAVDQHHVAGSCAIGRQLDAGADHADAGGGDEQLVAGAALHDLGVAGDHLHASVARRRGHRSGDRGAARRTAGLPR